MTDVFRSLFSSLRRRGLRVCVLMFCALSFFWGRAQTHVEHVLNMGRVALSYGDYITAISLFNRAVEARPYTAEADYLRAAAKSSLEDYASAATDLNEAIRLNPFRSEYYALRAICRIHAKQYEEAVADYGKVLSESPGDQTAQFNIAVCRLEQKQYPLADSLTEGFIRKWPSYVRAYLMKAQIKLLLRDTLSALNWMDSALVIRPNEAEAWDFKGRYALQKEKYALADSFLTQAVRNNANYADTYMARAQARHALNRYSQALSDYDRVISLIPEHFVAHYNRGLLRSFIGDDNRAIGDFDFVLKKEPNNTLARYNRAILRERVGQYAGAVSDYSLLLRAYPHFTAGYAARAKCRRRLGDVRGALSDESRVQRAYLDLFFSKPRRSVKKVRKRSEHALEQYDQLIEEEIDSARTFITAYSGKVQNRRVERVFLPPFRVIAVADTVADHRSVLYISVSGTLKENNAEMSANPGEAIAVEQLRRWLQSNSAAHRVLLWAQTAALFPNEQADEALALLEKATNLQPNVAYLYYNKGCVLGTQGRLEEAREAFSKALTLDDRMAEAYYNRGVAALLDGRPTDALPDLSRAGELGIYRAYNLIKQAKKTLQ